MFVDAPRLLSSRFAIRDRINNRITTRPALRSPFMSRPAYRERKIESKIQTNVERKRERSAFDFPSSGFASRDSNNVSQRLVHLPVKGSRVKKNIHNVIGEPFRYHALLVRRKFSDNSKLLANERIIIARAYGVRQRRTNNLTKEKGHGERAVGRLKNRSSQEFSITIMLPFRSIARRESAKYSLTATDRSIKSILNR